MEDEPTPDDALVNTFHVNVQLLLPRGVCREYSDLMVSPLMTASELENMLKESNIFDPVYHRIIFPGQVESAGRNGCLTLDEIGVREGGTLRIVYKMLQVQVQSICPGGNVYKYIDVLGSMTGGQLKFKLEQMGIYRPDCHLLRYSGSSGRMERPDDWTLAEIGAQDGDKVYADLRLRVISLHLSSCLLVPCLYQRNSKKVTVSW